MIFYPYLAQFAFIEIMTIFWKKTQNKSIFIPKRITNSLVKSNRDLVVIFVIRNRK